MISTLPNQLTTLRILLTPLFVGLFVSDSPKLKLWGVFVFILASLTDLYDGYHARKYGQITRWGAFMDPLADKILITSAFLIFVYEGFLPLWLVVIVALRDIVVTLLRLYAEIQNKPVVTSKSAKIKTLFQNVLAYVLLLLDTLRQKSFFGSSIAENALTWLKSPSVLWAMIFLTIFTVYTGFSYIIENSKTLREAYLGIRSNIKAIV
ncbi:MAG: CDP-diacylglycerol--glycerol-3-phosphate 3-phosphatidyltransferase [Chloroherpetonaceae bacterium]|nr:CDP-diacylglycerol--glycerol-3-phosphate 3-phosphatidyltransferase [Chloroherpetonaceae bacterium]